MKLLDKLSSRGLAAVVLACIAAVVGLEGIALMKGIDGVLLTTVIGGLFGVLGVSVGRASKKE